MDKKRWEEIKEKVYGPVKFESLATTILMLHSPLMSTQEALLIGGTTSGEVRKRFYTPAAVVEGFLTPEEANWARQEVERT